MANLSMQTGTVRDSNVVATSLSNIKAFVVYRDSMTSVGLLIMSYSETHGTHKTYCSSYGDYTKYIGCSKTAPIINGGTISWDSTTESQNLASGVDYTWIAYGEE